MRPPDRGRDRHARVPPPALSGRDTRAGNRGCQRQDLDLDAAYEHYCQLREAGHQVEVGEFVSNHPHDGESLRRMIDLHESVEAMVDFRDTPWPEPGGNHLGFEILATLGVGGAARVYLASELALGGRTVVVKFSIGGGYEAEMLGRLAHPNIVPVFSVHSDRMTGMTAVCMPYLGRSTLADILHSLFGAGASPHKGREVAEVLRQREPNAEFYQRHLAEFPPSWSIQRGTYVEAIANMGIHLADALAFTMKRRILHRDLKPSNILVTPSGRAMLLDFNLSLEAEKTVARLGGTLPYMPPEQIAQVFQGSHSGILLDTRSDLFSLAVILYEAFTGQLPFGLPADARTGAADYRESQRAGPRDIGRLTGQVGPHLARAIDRCLAFEMDERPESPAELADQLRRYLAPAPQLTRAANRNRRSIVLAGMASAALAAIPAAFYAAQPTKDEQLFREGLELIEVGSYDAAVERLGRSLERKPDASHVAFARGTAHLLNKSYGYAVVDFERLKQRSASKQVLECLAYALFQNSDFSGASVSYHEAADLARGRERARLLLNYAVSILSENDAEMAFRIASESIRLDPQLQSAYHFRARLLFRDSESFITPATARADIERALALGESSWLLDLDAAHVYARVSEESFEPLSSTIVSLLKRAAQKGARLLPLQTPWIRRWLDPAVLLQMRGTPRETDKHADPFLSEPDTQAIFARLAAGRI